MKGWHMYSKIQAINEQGFSIRQVSRIVRVSRNKIQKYWDIVLATQAREFDFFDG